MTMASMAARRGYAWLKVGWRLFRRDTTLWVAMAAFYLIMVAVLDQIPFIGYLLLVFVTPLMLAGALITAAEVEQTEPDHKKIDDWRAWLKLLTRRALISLLRVFVDPAKTLSVMVLATLLLGAVVVVQILAQLLKVGGPALPAMLQGSVGPSIWVPALISLFLVWLLKLLLAFGTLYAVQLVAIGEETPLGALEKSARALMNHAGAITVLALLLPVPLMLIASFSDIAVLLVSLLSLPMLVTSVYSSAQEVYS